MTPITVDIEQLICMSGGIQSPSDMPPADCRRMYHAARDALHSINVGGVLESI